MRFVKDHFDEYRESTIGGMFERFSPSSRYILYNKLTILFTAAFLAQTISLDDNTTVKFEIWYVC